MGARLGGVGRVSQVDGVVRRQPERPGADPAVRSACRGAGVDIRRHGVHQELDLPRRERTVLVQPDRAVALT
ncbi:hypothetical protein [Tsukamurella sp. PLM1]|uniref:hypothetical protein n=1 Tax=Tsukamurella sp. PLM1 TaxID=2929795 RepID=UPI00205F8961|nr:hypothetical protein [Tsukamurella sp. PLM1]BDH56621.1 hypothetical protein MTP03_15600 [Tsukamurella sp. PLM1]